MDVEAASRHRAIVARMTVGLGALGILFLLPELVVIGWKGYFPWEYIVLLVMNLAGGGAALVAGLALRRRRSWGWGIAAADWGAVAASSALIGIVITRQFHVSAANAYSVWIPRYVFGVASVLALPYIFWSLMTVSRTEGRSRLFMAILLLVSAALSWSGTAVLLKVHPITLCPAGLP